LLDGLPSVREPLDKLLSALPATQENGQTIAQLKSAASQSATACSNHLASDPVIAHLESNPFVNVSLRQPLMSALAEINNICSA
jgi:hypothetical protein